MLRPPPSPCSPGLTPTGGHRSQLPAARWSSSPCSPHVTHQNGAGATRDPRASSSSSPSRPHASLEQSQPGATGRGAELPTLNTPAATRRLLGATLGSAPSSKRPTQLSIKKIFHLDWRHPNCFTALLFLNADLNSSPRVRQPESSPAPAGTRRWRLLSSVHGPPQHPRPPAAQTPMSPVPSGMTRGGPGLQGAARPRKAADAVCLQDIPRSAQALLGEMVPRGTRVSRALTTQPACPHCNLAGRSQAEVKENHVRVLPWRIFHCRLRSRFSRPS